jgi:hypothetical protein
MCRRVGYSFVMLKSKIMQSEEQEQLLEGVVMGGVHGC